jgi:hypothetical protein
MAQIVLDLDLARDVMIKTFDELGGWDATFFPGGIINEIGWAMFGMASKLPGFDLPDDQIWQLDEKEIMQVEDYDFIQKNGWNAYLGYVYPRLGMRPPADQFLPNLIQLAVQGVKDTQIWEQKGVSVFAGMGPLPPFEAISFTRSFKELVADVYRRPEVVRATSQCILAESTAMAIHGLLETKKATQWGNRVAFIGATRASFLSPKQMDKFFWQDLKVIVNSLLEAGITPMLHFDSIWDNHLEKFLELPKGQVLLELDGTTNIFKAKEVLKGHMCLMGDVPASMLKLGTPEEVSAYVKKLIDVVGEGGGFILSTGCDCPIDAKLENVKAMIETGKSYYPHHKVF